MWIHKTPLQFFAPWGQIMPIRPKNHPKYQDGNSTSQTGIPEDPLEEGEEDRHRMPQDHLQEEEEEAAVEAEEEEEEVEAEAGEHFLCQDMPPLNKLKSF